eukprot:2829618-Rhodomonas_salina.1
MWTRADSGGLPHSTHRVHPHATHPVEEGAEGGARAGGGRGGTNAAYTRFWEGRCHWEHLTNKSRDMVRLLIAYRQVLGHQ